MKPPYDKFTSEQWDWWLTVEAECKAPKNKCINCIYVGQCGGCYFCKILNQDCFKCFGEEKGCFKIPFNQLVDRAIERLEKAWVWD